jgi:hypothetical protein
MLPSASAFAPAALAAQKPDIGVEPDTTPEPLSPREGAPAQIRGLYLTAHTAGSPERLGELLDLAGRTEINAFVVDVKTGSGIHYPSTVPLARELTRLGDVAIEELEALVDTLQAHDIYAIARVVTFKDPVLAKARPEWSIQTPGGDLWVDKAGNTWVSAWDERVWDYNLDIAEEAAQAGFDEIQFDYVRFPEPYQSLPRQVHPEAEGERTDAIAAFLSEAKRRLHPLGVTVTADVFGMAMNDAGDVGIGQQWERLSAVADHLLPMVYPSHYFPTHLPGVSQPNRMPRKTISTAVGMGVIRNDRLREAGATPARIVPWLQAFDAPWVDKDFPYGPEQARAQIEAVYEVGLEDWIFWHPGSRYAQVAAAFEPETEPRARPYDAPESLVGRMDRYEEWGMREARERALER